MENGDVFLIVWRYARRRDRIGHGRPRMNQGQRALALGVPSRSGDHKIGTRSQAAEPFRRQGGCPPNRRSAMTDAHHPDTPRNRGDRDAPHMSPVTPSEDARTIMLNKISWGAVFAGVVVMLVTQLILNLL